MDLLTKQVGVFEDIKTLCSNYKKDGPSINENILARKLVVCSVSICDSESVQLVSHKRVAPVGLRRRIISYVECSHSEILEDLKNRKTETTGFFNTAV